VQVGDIVKVLRTDEKKIVVDLRTEIVPISGDWSKTDEMRMRLMCQLAGDADRWYSKQEIEVFSPRVRR
jgi:hypothetical protein